MVLARNVFDKVWISSESTLIVYQLRDFGPLRLNSRREVGVCATQRLSAPIGRPSNEKPTYKDGRHEGQSEPLYEFIFP